MENLKAIIEAMIFAAEQPLSLDRIHEILPELEKAELSRVIEIMTNECREMGRGIVLAQVAGGFQFRTREDLNAWVKKSRASRPASLTVASLETLAIVAYRQPIVKAEIERLRGVDATAPLRGLLEKKLVRIVGRKDVPGKPIIYGTTRRFLEVFGLNDLSELPTLRELKDMEG
ncbi:MAG: SMC-Scp complex subunit ScpB [Smithellaceae bacterium]|nr:SMC-Scp complex subunit ScpB [Smithellaceae bacterium]